MHTGTEGFRPPRHNQTFGEVVSSFNKYGNSAARRHSHMSFAQQTRYPDPGCSIQDKVACLRELSRGPDSGSREVGYSSFTMAGSPRNGMSHSHAARSRTPSPSLARRPRSLPTTPRTYAAHGGWQSPRRTGSNAALGAPYAPGGVASGGHAESIARGASAGKFASHGPAGHLGISDATTAAGTSDGVGASASRWMMETERQIPRTPSRPPPAEPQARNGYGSGGYASGSSSYVGGSGTVPLSAAAGYAVGHNGNRSGDRCTEIGHDVRKTSREYAQREFTSESRPLFSGVGGSLGSTARAGAGPSGGVGGYAGEGAYMSTSSSASRFVDARAAYTATGASAHGQSHPRSASFVRLNTFLLRTHITSLVSALAEDGWLEVWEKERLCRQAREDSQPWVMSFLRVYSRFLETDDVQVFVADLRAHIS